VLNIYTVTFYILIFSLRINTISYDLLFTRRSVITLIFDICHASSDNGLD